MHGSKVVKFNVGGTRYDVSQSLLDLYPTCMLTRMLSTDWGGTGHNDGDATDNDKDNRNDEAIFIDRNGERFQYVLDYMRDERIELP